MTALFGPPRRTTSRPATGVPYRLKVGKSLLRPRNRQSRQTSSSSSAAASRELLALKFTHVPDGTMTSSRGQLTREDNNVTVELAAKEVGQTQLFTGQRRKSREDATSSDYVLIFVDGSFWLERVTDYANCLRPGERKVDRKFNPDSTSASVDDIAADPDSWMPGADLESASPITPEDDMVADDVSRGNGGGCANLSLHRHSVNGVVASAVRNGFAGKGVPGGPSGGLVGLSGGGANINAGSRQMVIPSRGMVGSKSLAAKTLAVKSVANVHGPASKRRSDAVEEDDSEEVELEIDEGENDVDGDGDVGNDDTNDTNSSDDDRQSKSSSSDDDSEDSDSDSDSDSPDYTTESSDE